MGQEEARLVVSPDMGGDLEIRNRPGQTPKAMGVACPAAREGGRQSFSLPEAAVRDPPHEELEDPRRADRSQRKPGKWTQKDGAGLLRVVCRFHGDPVTAGEGKGMA